MKNAVAVAVLTVGLALGSATASFGDNVDGGAHPRSGVPTVGEHGANTATGISRTNPHPPEARMKQHRVSKHRRKKNKK